ncbi:EamA family transporter [Geobacillus stearothermophilus]
MWIVYALLAAVFAALTSVLAKIGIENVNSHLATAIRTAVVLVLAWMIVWMTGAHQGVKAISTKSWVFLCLSGAATGCRGFVSTKQSKSAMSRASPPLTSRAWC